MNEKFTRLKELLDEKYSGDFDFMFKFIVPVDSLSELKSLLGEEKISEKPSRKGKYVSVTMKTRVENSQQVMDVYEKVSVIEGVISL